MVGEHREHDGGESDRADSDNVIPRSIQTRLTTSLSFLAICGMALLISQAAVAPNTLEHVRLDLLVIFCVAGLALLNVRWHRLGRVVSKVGPVEFRRVIEMQQKEHAQAIAPIQFALGKLEGQVGALAASANSMTTPPSSTAPSSTMTSATSGSSLHVAAPTTTDWRAALNAEPLAQLIVSFLNAHSRYSFNATRISKWGRGQPGFEQLGKYSLDQIRQCLTQLAADERVCIKMSSSGSTLYRATQL